MQFFFNKLCNNVFKHANKGKLDFGTQSFQITHYLFGVLGFGSYNDLRDNARHRTDAMATKYYQDSPTLRHNMITHWNTVESQSVPEFYNSILHGSGNNLR